MISARHIYKQNVSGLWAQSPLAWDHKFYNIASSAIKTIVTRNLSSTSLISESLTDHVAGWADGLVCALKIIFCLKEHNNPRA